MPVFDGTDPPSLELRQPLVISTTVAGSDAVFHDHDLTNIGDARSIGGRRPRRETGVTTLAAARLTLRVDLGEGRAIGPGKIRLLEAIRDTGSITRAGITLGMSYRRAWLLVDDMNNCFREPVVAAQAGGSHGGGAALTPFGKRLIDQYRKIEAKAHSANAARLRELEAACQGEPEAPAAKSPPPLRRRTIAR